jgi:hypothetical protein
VFKEYILYLKMVSSTYVWAYQTHLNWVEGRRYWTRQSQRYHEQQMQYFERYFNPHRFVSLCPWEHE